MMTCTTVYIYMYNVITTFTPQIKGNSSNVSEKTKVLNNPSKRNIQASQTYKALCYHKDPFPLVDLNFK